MTARLLSSAFTSAPLLLSLATLGWGRTRLRAVGGWRSLADGQVFMRRTIVFAILLVTQRKRLPASLR